MTNREKFEQEKLSFAEVLEIFNKTGMDDFNQFLNEQSCKYKKGDIVVLDLTKEVREKAWKHNIVMSIDGFICDDSYEVTFLTPEDEDHPVGLHRRFTVDFLDNNSHLY